MMPEMDGIEAAAIIREWEKESGSREQIPIIALTANAVTGMRELFMKKGFNDFLTKPIDMSKLDEMLERWIPKEKRAMNNERLAADEKNEGQDNLPGNDAGSTCPAMTPVPRCPPFRALIWKKASP